MPGYWVRLWLVAALFTANAWSATESDPPGRVGRISLATEGVQLRIGDSVAYGGEALNWPLTSGAVIETSGTARAEARIGTTTLRLDGGALLEFVELGDQRIWLRLNRGNLILEIRSSEHAAGLVVDAHKARIRFDAPGSYRSDAAGGTTALSVYAGAANIEEPALAVHAGERVLLLGGTEGHYVLGQATHDAFRQWSLARSRPDGHTSRLLSPEMTGYEELDRHGSWSETAEYGPAWFPQDLPAGWAPYRWGRWIWLSPWGWTWIDHAPWGFAPFHYGRWAIVGGRWAWLPGAYASRPVYAPALVVWLGQPGWSATFDSGRAPAVGWYPLGPREIYYPHYRSSRQHVRNLNVAHAADMARIERTKPSAEHVHRHSREAVTIVPEKLLRSGAPVDRKALPSELPSLAYVPTHNMPPLPGRPQDDARSSSSPAPSAVPSPHAGSWPAQSYPADPAASLRRSEARPHAPADMPAATITTRSPAGSVVPANPVVQPGEHRPAQPATLTAPVAPRHQAASTETGRGQDFRSERMPKENPPMKAREQMLREMRNKPNGQDR